MPDSTPTTHATDGVAILARVAAHLEATARKLWARAEAEGPLTATYTIAQDLHLDPVTGRSAGDDDAPRTAGNSRDLFHRLRRPDFARFDDRAGMVARQPSSGIRRRLQHVTAKPAVSFR